MGHGHDHTHGMAKKSLRLAFFLTILIVLVGVAGGILSHSLALLSDAAHIVTDLFALGLAWFAAAQAERPANAQKTFGYHRVGILAALANSVILIVVAIGITWEAIQRFQHPEPVTPGILFVTAFIAITLNLFIAFGLRGEHGHNLNVRAVLLHTLGDIGASFGVVVAGLVILLTGWMPIDPLLSVAIALYIAYGAWGIVRETTDILLESVPRDLNTELLVQDMQQIEGVKAVHDLHIWCIASGMTTLSSHVSIEDVSSPEQARILHDLTDLLEQKYHIHHATMQLECRAHTTGCCQKEQLYCQLDVSHTHEHHHDHDHEHEHEHTHDDLSMHLSA